MHSGVFCSNAHELLDRNNPTSYLLGGYWHQAEIFAQTRKLVRILDKCVQDSGDGFATSGVVPCGSLDARVGHDVNI